MLILEVVYSINQLKTTASQKYAKVPPTHNGKPKMECSNYRPISFLPLFSKIIERLLYNRLVSFVTKYDILYQHQYGFQSDRSIELARHIEYYYIT